jgi:hypothetical protein
MRTLTPDDIKRENAFRAAQRKAGKSRKSNIKDPNAPKKPLSAYFMFLQRIRSDSLLVKEVFGDETETTKQSVLAAAKWRSMTDDERKVMISPPSHPYRSTNFLYLISRSLRRLNKRSWITKRQGDCTRKEPSRTGQASTLVFYLVVLPRPSSAPARRLNWSLVVRRARAKDLRLTTGWVLVSDLFLIDILSIYDNAEV